MEYDELKRLAIRLSLSQVADSDGLIYCRECKGAHRPWTTMMCHKPDCLIAKLEEEELAAKPPEALKLSVGGMSFETVPAWKAQFVRDSGEDWLAELTGNWIPISFDMSDGKTSMTGWVRSVPTPKKAAGKFEGEY